MFSGAFAMGNHAPGNTFNAYPYKLMINFRRSGIVFTVTTCIHGIYDVVVLPTFTDIVFGRF